jgi:integrase
MDASGIGHGTIYTLRHTAISNRLAAGIGSIEAARYAGTSIEMIERHYGHLLLAVDRCVG